MRNVELYFTGTTVIYALQPFAAACSKIARTSVKVGKTRLLRPLVLLRVQERIYQSKLSTDHSSGERWYEIVEVHSVAEKTGAVATKQASAVYTTLHESAVWAFCKNNNLLLTERRGRTEEYWLEVVAVRTERSEVRTKTTESQYSQVRLEQARLVSSLLYGTRVMLVLKLPAFENKKYTSCDRFHGNGPYGKSRPSKNQSERSDLPQDYVAI